MERVTYAERLSPADMDFFLALANMAGGMVKETLVTFFPVAGRPTCLGGVVSLIAGRLNIH